MTTFFATPWIPTVALLFLALGARLLSKSWLAPGPFALLLWSIYMVVPLALAPEYKVSALGAWLILLLVACIAIGADFGAGQTSSKPGGKSQSRQNTCVQNLSAKPLLRLSMVLSGLSLLGVFYSADKALGDYSLDFSLPNLLLLGHLLSVERYSGEQPPFAVRALVIWVFAAALLAGMAYCRATTRRDRLLCFAPLIPALLYSIVQAARSNTLIVIAMGLSGYMAMRVAAGMDRHGPITRKGLIFATASVMAALIFFFIVDNLRSHTQQEQDIQTDADWGRAKSAALGYLAVFGHWAESTDGPGAFHMSLGAYTIGGLFDLTGLHTRESGVYTGSVSLEGDDSNIYTAFRGLIQDFSLPGAVAACISIGFLAGRAYKNSLFGNWNWTPILAAFYTFVFWSPIISIFEYNGPLLAILVGIYATRRQPNRARIGAASAESSGKLLRST